MKSKLLGHSANDLFWFILPLLLPSLLDRFDLTYSQGGGILTIYLTVTAMGSFFIGKLSDRISRRKIIAWGSITASAGLIMSGFAPTFIAFIAILSFTALGVSTFHPVMYAVLDEEYSSEKNRVMSLYETAGTAAILIMFLLNGYLLEKIGMRGVLIITALPSLAMGLYFLFSNSIKEHKKSKSLSEEGGEPAGTIEVLRFSAFLLSVILRVIAVAAVLNFLPTILTDFLKFSRETASYGSAFFFAGGIAGSLAAGRYSGRFSPMPVLIAGTLLIIPSIAALTLALPFWGYLILISLFGFFGSGCIISQNLLLTSMGSHLGKGEVFGILMGALTLTSAFSPALFGISADKMGFEYSLQIFSTPLLLSSLLLFLLLEKKGFAASKK